MSESPKNDAAPTGIGAGVQDQTAAPESTHLSPPKGVSLAAWERLAKPERGRWAIPERNAVGEVVGTAYRAASGSKTFKSGGQRGLILPWPLPDYAGSSDTDPVFVCEGASDTAALMGLGLDAVGIPMAGHCGDDLATLLFGRHVCIVSDTDEAGRRGATKIAGALLGSCASVRIIEPPENAKDARAAVIAGAGRDDFVNLARSSVPAQASSAGATLEGATLATGDPVLLDLSTVRPEPVRWLWRGRIALGKLTLIAGDPGLGKSFLTLDIAARVSKGLAWPDAPGVPIEAGGVVILSAEDDPADTIVPRLMAAGADLSPGRFTLLQATAARDQQGRRTERAVNLETDLPALEAAIRATPNCRFVLIDPISAYTGKADSHVNAEIRGLLAPLAKLAADLGVAIVLVTHLNKTSGGKALYRAIGSIAFAAAARSAFVVVKDKDDPARRLLLPTKNNLAPDSTGLAYRLGTPPDGAVPIVQWEANPVDLAADDAMGGEFEGGRTEVDEAADWLRKYLVDGPRPVTEVEEEARAAGFSKATLRRARSKVDAVSDKVGFQGATRWVLALPGEGDHAAEGMHEGAHSPKSECLRTKPAENNGVHSKALSSNGVSAFDERLGENERLSGVAGVCPICGGRLFWRYPSDPPGRRSCRTCSPPTHAAAAVDTSTASEVPP